MEEYRYEVGDLVDMVPGKQSWAALTGRFEVTRRLPFEGTQAQYRIRSLADGHERVVREAQLG